MSGNLPGHGNGQTGSGPFYRPYKDDACNHLYNLLFCDDAALFRAGTEKSGPLAAVLAPDSDREALERIGNDSDAESRVRALAFNRLRAMNVPVPDKRLLGTILEVPQKGGLDALAIFDDGRLRYINQSERPVIFEAAPPELAAKARQVIAASQRVVDRIGRSDEPRRSPPTGDLARMSFLVSDGLYFGEGRFDDLFADQLAAPVIGNASELLAMLVDVALDKERQSGPQT